MIRYLQKGAVVMKKIVFIASICLILCIAFALLAACGKNKSDAESSDEASIDDPSDTSLVGMPNPLVATDRDGFISKLGFYMNEPENAENVRYCVIANTVGEMSFVKGGIEYVARMKDYPDPIEIGSKEAMDQYIALSGYCCDFTTTETCKIGYCDGEIIEHKIKDTGKTVQIVAWDDVVPGFLYTLSVEETDLDGFDITAAANEIFAPMQGDAE